MLMGKSRLVNNAFETGKAAEHHAEYRAWQPQNDLHVSNPERGMIDSIKQTKGSGPQDQDLPQWGSLGSSAAAPKPIHL